MTSLSIRPSDGRTYRRAKQASHKGGEPVEALVLDGAQRQSLVAARVLGRSGLRVAVAEAADLGDRRFVPPAFASRWSLHNAVLPSYHGEPSGYVKGLLELLVERPARVLLPSMDGSIAAIRPYRSSFEELNVALALASESALEVANDKRRTLDVANILGIPTPRTVPIGRLDDAPMALTEVGYPAVIKPVRSWVAHGPIGCRVASQVVLDEHEAVQCVGRFHQIGSPVVAQQWVGGAREAVSIFYAHGRVWAAFAQLARRTVPVLGGVSVVRESVPMPPELWSNAVALVEALELEGYCEVEFRRDAQGLPLLMEINARLSGSLEVAVRSGVDFPLLLWQWSAGESLTPNPDYRTGVRMRYLKGDVKWLQENLECRGRPDSVAPARAVWTFARDFLRRQGYDYVDQGDVRPAWAAFAADVGVAGRRAGKKVKGRLGRALRPPSGNVRRASAPSGNEHRAPTRRSRSSGDADVVVVGAGPNGLSIAAHLADTGVEHRVFGRPMGSWRFHMPDGMLLKSEPYASDLSAPGSGFLVRDHCRETGEVYHERVIPLSRDQFVAYGTWFARQLVADIEETDVVSVTGDADGGFLIRTARGEQLRAARVVVATGVMPFAHLPDEVAGLPSCVASHSSEHTDLGRFRGSEVLVVGGGSSALEMAALLHEQGTEVKVLVRGDGVFWPPANPASVTRLQQFRRPVARLCEGWPCWAYDRLPDVFRLLPASSRIERGLGFLGPQGAWWLKDRVVGKFPLLVDHQLVGSEMVGDRVRLHLQTPGGRVTEEADHVVAGTGFRLDLSRLGYLDPALRARVKIFAGAPVLDRHFESSVEGLFFVGALAAPSLGPLMRFVAGTHFTGPRVARRLRRQAEAPRS